MNLVGGHMLLNLNSVSKFPKNQPVFQTNIYIERERENAYTVMDIDIRQLYK